MVRPGVCVFVLAGLTSFAVQAAPRTPRGHLDARPIDNELFVSTPEAPRVLKSKQPGTITRAYVEAMARPRLPASMLDAVAVAVPSKGPPMVLQSPEAPALAAGAISVRDRVIIIEGDALVGTGQNGFTFDHNGNGANAVMQQVVGTYGDQFDFVTVFTTFDDANVAAYYLPLKNDVEGLGECDFNNGRTFGCLFSQLGAQIEVLHGFVFMNSLSFWQDWDRNYDGVVHPFDSFDSGVFSTLGQEIAHRWGSGLRFVDRRTDRVSNLLLGRDNSHWAAYVDSDASVMDGWDWSEKSAGAFDLVGDMDRFSTLDLYTLGALPVAAAEPFFVIDNAVYDIGGNDRIGLDGRAVGASDVLQLPSNALMRSIGMEVGATGEKVPVTIQDVVDAEGNRCPDPDATQKTFRQAVVLVTRPGQTIAQVEAAGMIADLDTVLLTWERWWLERTNKRFTLCTDLLGRCAHPEQVLGGGGVAVDGDSAQAGSSVEVTLTLTAKNAAIEGAVVTLRAQGAGAEFLTVPATVDVGDVASGATKTVRFSVDLADDYPCGTGAVIVATSTSANAADVTEEVRFFPGMKTVREETFANDDNGFKVDAAGTDTTTAATSGALRYTNPVELTCDMSRRTPERDASPDNDGAFLTGPGTDHTPDLGNGPPTPGEGSELDGTTSLTGPRFDLTGLNDPEVRFAYWFGGGAGDRLTVELSEDGSGFVAGKEVTASHHGWLVGLVNIKEAFGGALPETATVRFTFTGNGSLEGGIDDVRLLDYDGACIIAPTGGPCGCTENGETTPAAPLAGLLGLFGLRGLRRRRR